MLPNQMSVIRCEPFSNWYRIVQAFLAGEVYGDEIGMIIDKDCEHDETPLHRLRKGACIVREDQMAKSCRW